MSVIIGHAIYDEDGNTAGGAAGDQTGKEVCRREWYARENGWTAVFRAKDPAVAEKIAKTMEAACDNSKIGYDQNQRTTLYIKAKAANWDISKITVNCECDCSTLVAVCVNAAGITVSKDMYTGNERAVLTATGAFEVLADSKYLASDEYLTRGDIIMGPGHTAVVLENGAKITEEGYTMEMRTLKKGMKGEDVKALQILLEGRGYPCGKGATGSFGSGTENAVKKYQKAKGLTADGIVGEKTMRSLMGIT